MASLVRFSSKLLNKPSLYGSSSSSPLSYLTHSRHHFLVPKISNSLSSIFNRNCTSKSTADSSSSPDQLLLNDSRTYFLAGARHDNPSNLNRRVSCKINESYHKKYLDQLPKELYNITPEEFRRGTGILLESMETLRVVYSVGILYWGLLLGSLIYCVGELNIGYELVIGSNFVAKLMEISSIEKVVLLRNLQKQGKIPIQTAALQLVKEVKKSDRRILAVGCVALFVALCHIISFVIEVIFVTLSSMI